MNPKTNSAQSTFVNILTFALISAVFYYMAYYSVSDLLPGSVPVHHDDYTNYSSAAGGLALSWIRPLSTWLIYIFSSQGPDWLIWAVRFFTVTYVFLAWKILIEVVRPRQQWITLVLFALAALCSPIVAEYARYTGMVTHMMSGCLGLAAVYCLFKSERETNDGWLYASVALLVMSTLAKEDFILFYVFSYAYVMVKSKKPVKRRLLIGLTGLAISLVMVAGAKFLAASSFLGASDAQSSYFIDTSITGVANTVWRYLTGAGHPAMIIHGKIIAAAFIFASIVALIVLVRDRQIPKSLYVVGATLTLIAPYSVLPNHVNAYYELIWLPFIIGAVFVSLAELLITGKPPVVRSYAACALLAALALMLNVTDSPGRFSVAQWYDAVGADNEKILKQLADNKTAINEASSVCVYGANAFSPWYMHSGQYLETVMGLHTEWNVVADKSSALYPGFQQGAVSSKGRIHVIDAFDAEANCLKLTLAGAQ
ncbi:hypothetical protein PS718_02761 [Pseudomonas fluorescens]|uniref:Glycosyltransferase RgtA/B/C/D-like domain-containing protein n=1 Tax=Pseudomonas fluorescens TaxID=294 RepID=A0A5E7CJ57_PSEFL|nr:hypothetical protein [Pseudomonas fluorescens]VVO02258.1 hypothetical protein PS718_02761 [Pseudomonas fluorescens]